MSALLPRAPTPSAVSADFYQRLRSGSAAAVLPFAVVAPSCGVVFEVGSAR